MSIVISNHVKKIGLDFPKDAVVRINVAWVKDLEDLISIIEENKDNPIWVDYPTGRTKPPVPKLMLAEVISILNRFNNIKYFAFSNAEDCNIIQLIRQAVPKHIKLIPKIETEKGIFNLEKICKAAETDSVMLDQEDLYSDCGNVPSYLNRYLDDFNVAAKKLRLNVFKLSGVIFCDKQS